MTGDIPIEIYGLTNLNSLNIGNVIGRGNAFRGSIPNNVESLTALSGLLFHNIHLFGTIPSVIGRLKNLRELFD